MKTELNYITLYDRPGSLLDAIKVLSEKSIDLRFVAAQRLSNTVGFTYLLAKQSEKTSVVQEMREEQQALNSSIIEAIPILIEDTPGALRGALEVLAAKKINIEFCFVFSIGNGQAIGLIGLELGATNVLKQATEALASNGVNTSPDFLMK